MKMARFLFTIIGLGALSLGLGFAGEPPGQTKSTTGKAVDLHQYGSNKAAAAAKDGATISKSENHRGLPVTGHSTSPPPTQAAPRRIPGPASIGGLANSSAKNTAVINGTGMKHGP